MRWPEKKIERSDLSLIVRARKMLEEQDLFLLVFDIKGCRNWNLTMGEKELFRRVDNFCSKVTRKYSKYIVRGELNARLHIRSFRRIIGDGGGGYFNNAEVIAKIMALANKELYPIEFWWNVARDIWDKENSRIMA